MWNGPSWFKESEEVWPKQITTVIFNAATTIKETNFLDELIPKMSNYNKLIRVVAYVVRFIGKLKKSKFSTFLSTDEINHAKTMLIRNVQMRLFPEEILLLKNNKEIPTKNKICSLNPYLDENKVLRVGGRLANSCLNHSRKHPILLASFSLLR